VPSLRASRLALRNSSVLNAQRPAGTAGFNGRCKRPGAFRYWGSTRVALAGKLRYVIQTVIGFTNKGLRVPVARRYLPTKVPTLCVTKYADSDDHSLLFTT